MGLGSEKFTKAQNRVFIALLVNYYRVNECEHERIYSEDLM
jgi:hypothetical protein